MRHAARRGARQKVARSTRRGSTARAASPRARRADRSAGRHSGGCRRTYSKPTALSGDCRGRVPARLDKRMRRRVSGWPVVPEVKRIHSLSALVRRSTERGRERLHRHDRRPAPASDPASRRLAAAATSASLSGVRSGVHSTIRRATPSSSSSATAVLSCSRSASSTERPRSASSLPARQDAVPSSASAMEASGP